MGAGGDSEQGYPKVHNWIGRWEEGWGEPICGSRNSASFVPVTSGCVMTPTGFCGQIFIYITLFLAENTLKYVSIGNTIRYNLILTHIPSPGEGSQHFLHLNGASFCSKND